MDCLPIFKAGFAPRYMPMRFRIVLSLALAAISSLAAAVIPPEVQTEVVEFYHKDLDHYFITTNPKEISDLDTGVHAGWVRTGFKFASVKIGSTQAATTPVCRFYGKPEAKIDSHFYSSKAVGVRRRQGQVSRRVAVRGR